MNLTAVLFLHFSVGCDFHGFNEGEMVGEGSFVEGQCKLLQVLFCNPE